MVEVQLVVEVVLADIEKEKIPQLIPIQLLLKLLDLVYQFQFKLILLQ